MLVELEPMPPKVRPGCGLRRLAWSGVVSHTETASPLALDIAAGLHCSKSRPVARQQITAERMSLTKRYLASDWFMTPPFTSEPGCRASRRRGDATASAT